MSQFNSWFLVLPLLAVASFTLGRLNIRHNHHNQKVQRLHGAPLLAVSFLWGVGCAVLLGWLIFVESFSGLIELLGRNDPDAPIAAAFIVAGVCFIFGVVQFALLYAVSSAADEPTSMYRNSTYRRQSRIKMLLARFTGCRRGCEQLLKRLVAYHAKRSAAKVAKLVAAAAGTTSATASSTTNTVPGAITKATTGTRTAHTTVDTTACIASELTSQPKIAPRQHPVPVQEAIDAARPETYILSQIEYSDLCRTIQSLIKNGAELGRVYIVLTKVRSERIRTMSSNILDFEERRRRWRSAQ